MRTSVPNRAGDRPPPGWALRRAARLDFPATATVAADPGHTARLRIYLTDLLRPYGLALDPDRPLDAGQSYGEMAEVLIRSALPAGEQAELLVLAHGVPDVTPGRATATWLSHVCPGGPLAFAVSDQGAAGAFTALRLLDAYVRGGELRRALLLVVEQPTLFHPAGDAEPLPAGAAGVALLFGEPLPGERVARPGPVLTRTAAGPDQLAVFVRGFGAAGEVSVVLGGGAAGWAGALEGGAGRVRVAEPGRPGTGVWWELAGELGGEPGAGRPRRVVLADHDAATGQLSLAAFDLGAGAEPFGTGPAGARAAGSAGTASRAPGARAAGETGTAPGAHRAEAPAVAGHALTATPAGAGTTARGVAR
jgi:4-hydroxymandelate oxidase